jgi:hypothetical protein
MQISDEIARAGRVIPWNKGKTQTTVPDEARVGDPKQAVEARPRELAIFTRAIDSKLREVDLVKLRSEDVAPHGEPIDGAMVRQQRQPADILQRSTAARQRSPQGNGQGGSARANWCETFLVIV